MKTNILLWKHENDNMQQYRLHPNAVAKDLLGDYDSLKPLTTREMERVRFALRFITDIPDILERLDADGARHAIQKMKENQTKTT